MTRRHATQPQATRHTQQELAYLAYWEARGYKFKRGEKPPLSTETPPLRAQEDSLFETALGSLILASIFGGLTVFWLLKAIE